MPGGDWLRAGPVGGCVMTPPADPRREPAAAVRCGGGSGGAEPGRGVVLSVPGWAAPRRWVRRHRGERCMEPGPGSRSVPRSLRWERSPLPGAQRGGGRGSVGFGSMWGCAGAVPAFGVRGRGYLCGGSRWGGRGCGRGRPAPGGGRPRG